LTIDPHRTARSPITATTTTMSGLEKALFNLKVRSARPT
jgi:hypothetical protein